MPNLLSNKLTLVQATQECSFSEIQYRDIAELIFETDDFIYPALFGDEPDGKRNAAVIIPELFETGRDPMFSKNNLYLAFIGSRIVGLILWHKGVLDWTPSHILDHAAENSILLNMADVEKVRREYVSARYANDDAGSNAISIINVCVRKENRGTGIADRMLQAFLDNHKAEAMELAVLAENHAAVSLYEKHGFQIKEETDGFSRYTDKPRCLTMKRAAEASSGKC